MSVRPARALLAVALLVLAGRAAHGAIALVQSAQGASSGDASSIAATFPSAPGSGDLLIAIAGNLAASSPATPTGWSVAIDETANAPGQVIFYRIAAAAEPDATALATDGI